MTDWAGIIIALTGFLTALGGLIVVWRKLEVIRVDVNSSKSLLELKLAQALSETALLRKSEAARTGDWADATAAQRAVGAAEQAAKPTAPEVAGAVAVQAGPQGAQGPKPQG